MRALDIGLINFLDDLFGKVRSQSLILVGIVKIDRRIIDCLRHISKVDVQHLNPSLFSLHSDLSSQMQHIRQNHHLTLLYRYSALIAIHSHAKTAPVSCYGNRGGSLALFVLFQALTQLLAGRLNRSLGGCQNCRVLGITTSHHFRFFS